MIYLGSPYTDPDPFVREQRYLAAAKKVVEYLKAGIWVYSPIVHCHELQKIVNLGTASAFWRPYNYHMLEVSSELHVLQLEGWASSEGLGDEVQRMTQLQKPIKYVKP